MERQLDAYCEHLRSERQVSPHTLSAYRRDLDKVLGWCNKQNIGSWQALDIQRLRSLIARLHAQGQSSRSLARLLSAVRGLYHYLNREGLCDHDPATGLAPPKASAACQKLSIPTAPCNCSKGPWRTISWLGVIRRFWSCSILPGCACQS